MGHPNEKPSLPPLSLYCDGSVTGGAWGKKTGPRSPPRNYIGWVVRDAGAWVQHHAFDMGESETFSGNTAEHFAVNSGLRWLLQNGLGNRELIVHTDSQLIVGHLSGAFNIHKPILATIATSTKNLAAGFPKITYRWIPREQNRYADYLSKVLQPKFGAPGLPAGEISPETIASWK